MRSEDRSQGTKLTLSEGVKKGVFKMWEMVYPPLAQRFIPSGTTPSISNPMRKSSGQENFVSTFFHIEHNHSFICSQTVMHLHVYLLLQGPLMI